MVSKDLFKFVTLFFYIYFIFESRVILILSFCLYYITVHVIILVQPNTRNVSTYSAIVPELCSSLPILSLSGVDRHNCISPGLSVQCELWIELSFFHIILLSLGLPHGLFPPTFIVAFSSRFLCFSALCSAPHSLPYIKVGLMTVLNSLFFS